MTTGCFADEAANDWFGRSNHSHKISEAKL